VVALALALLLGFLARSAAEDRADRSFGRLAVVVAGSVVAPWLTPDLPQGQPADSTSLTRAVDELRNAGPIVSVTVRDQNGKVLWSDPPGSSNRLLQPEERTALQDGSLVLTPDSATAAGTPTNLASASVGVRGTAGNPLLVEMTGHRLDMAAATREAWTRFAPASLGALLLLELIQLPLLWRLARQLRRHEDAEDALRESAVSATDVERRRIAREVHDDVLPGLHGLTYDLDAARLSARGGESAALLDRSADCLRASIRQLRALLLDLSQTRMPDAGLGPALAGLADQLEVGGVGVSISTAGVERISPYTSEVLYRCAHEALRNVATHSGAEAVEVSVSVDADTATLTIDDDGRGFEETRLTESQTAGHLGLRTLGDLVADSGGSLTASSAPGQGTRLVVRVPLDDVGADMRVFQ
jgi:signal transduction histidine kinase